MHGKKVLIIDDDPAIRRLLVDLFSKTGAQVISANNGDEGLKQFYVHRPDLVILDVMMPYLDGWQTCTGILKISKAPIIMLTALDAEDKVIYGLNQGAVDYVTKPFSPNILLARAKAALRQTPPTAPGSGQTTYHDDYLTIDLKRRRVSVTGETVKLSSKEYGLLRYLVENAGRVLSVRQILENVWGWEYHSSDNYVHVYISHLRRKLEKNPKQPAYLLTEHGVGYIFERQQP